MTKIEFVSTTDRKYREHEISIETHNALIVKFQDDIKKRYELLRFSSLVVDEAWSLIRHFAEEHSLRTLDSLQFAFLRTYCEEDNIFVKPLFLGCNSYFPLI
ncbi:type II toxin-antitoxin system VapC family toxin [Dehalococcoidia bacterium]|nr:type II toxin-antitoxin system VapC family toxin [Dehalococcoidia bacterium]